VVGRQSFGAASRVLPYLTILFVPIILGMPHLYEWTHADVVAKDEILQGKAAYLNPTFFIVRAVIYFAGWVGIATLLNKWSRMQDAGDVAVNTRIQRLSGAGLVFYALAVTFAGIDWIMSLNPHWYSTIFGFLMIGGQGLAALAFTIIVSTFLFKHAPMSGLLKPHHFHDLGKLMFAFVMLWAYFSFSQFLIIWAGNLPEEITFYLARLGNGWQYLSALIVAGHFVLPFCLLLSADLKRRPRSLAAVALFIVAIRLVDIIWLVAPNFNQKGMPISLANVGVPLALAGFWVVLFAGQLRKWALVPVNDPYFKDMLAQGSGGH